MKMWNIKMFMLLSALLMVTGFDAVAQRGQGLERRGGMQQVCPNIPGLTEEQSSEIMKLRTQHLVEMQSYRDMIDINRAQYRALMRAGAADMAAINSNIEERSGIRSQMEKKQAAHHQAIRSLLTEEQVIWFDAAPRGGPGMGQARPYGRGTRGPGIMRNQPPFRRGY
jgi:Spy/CpxP family protein refolding chaperone